MYPFVPDMRLFHDRTRCEEWCERTYGERPSLKDADAQTFNWDGTAIVLMEYDGRRVDEDMLLVHEAYHVVTANLEAIGEAEAGEETVAYMLQCTAAALVMAHRKWRRRHGRKGHRQHKGGK